MTNHPPAVDNEDNPATSFTVMPGDLSEFEDPLVKPAPAAAMVGSGTQANPNPVPPAGNAAPPQIAFLPPPIDFPGSGETLHGASTEGVEKQIDLLRRLRVEILDLEWLLARVKSGEVTLKTYAPYVEKTRRDIQGLVAKLQGGDTAGRIRNNWEMMRLNPLIAEPAQDLDTQEQLRSLEMLEHNSSEITFLIGLVTIPSRLNDWLGGSRPGYYIPFHTVFEDELPKAEDRTRLLNLMAYTPAQIKDGFIDPASGLIYRYNADPGKRLLSLVWIGLALIIFSAIAIGSCWLGKALPGWPLTPANAGVIAAGWLVLLSGVIVHLGVSELKRGQTAGGLPPILVLEDLQYIIDSRKSQIILKLGLALVGLFGLVFSTAPAKLTILSFFLVGYSLDSFLDLFIKSVDQKASAQMTTLQKQANGGD